MALWDYLGLGGRERRGWIARCRGTGVPPVRFRIRGAGVPPVRFQIRGTGVPPVRFRIRGTGVSPVRVHARDAHATMVVYDTKTLAPHRWEPAFCTL